MKTFQFFLSLVIGAFLLEGEPALAKGSKIPCRLRDSNKCRNPDRFLRDKRDGCANPLGACYRKFCKHNCFGYNLPKRTTKPGTIYSLCQANCNGNEFPQMTRAQRVLFEQRFMDRHMKRRLEAMEYARRVQGALFDKCNTRCDFDPERPSCGTTDWADCAKDCHFLEDIKEHAERCAQRPPIKPKPVGIVVRESTRRRGQ